MLLLLILMRAVLGEVVPRQRSFDSGWLFHRGAAPLPSHCTNESFPIDMGQTQCMGLTMVPASTPGACQDVCCEENTCTTWQFCPSGAGCVGDGVPRDSCWVGTMGNCHPTTNGWISRGRDGPPHTCQNPFCQPTFDDHMWAAVDTPHDWSIHDLPPRSEDTTNPTLVVRNGTWLFHKGDNASWSTTNLDDRSWTKIHVPSDWRSPPLSYTEKNAMGWYRRHINISGDIVAGAAFGRLRLDLGTVAAADETYLNGHKLGGMGNFKSVNCRDYLTWRSYPVPIGVLNTGKGAINVVAVRVYSEGGPVGQSGHPGGLFDSGGPDERVGFEDAGPSPGQRQTGYAVGGEGWYRKHFTLTKADLTSNVVVLRFDGVYMNSDTWVNGVHVGRHPYGYTTFEYDVTPQLKIGVNVIAVRVRNDGSNSRWYSGSGIFRHVWLVVTPEIRLGYVFVTNSKSVHWSEMDITVLAGKEGSTVTVTTDIVDPRGAAVGTNTTTGVVVSSSSNITIQQGIEIPHPQLWGPDTPVLYTATVRLTSDHHGTTDTVSTTFGIRTLHFDSKRGFVLNGVPLKLRGGCVHHANGPLGSAAIDRAEERRVELLKAQGYNAIRTSHNPVSPAFVAACDRLGMLLMEEAFDCWGWGKNPQDYHVDFDAWWQRDIASMVLRDRNHPSIIMWSIGNEIPMRNSPQGIALSKALADRVRSLDPGSGRAVTSAYPGVGNAADPFFAPLDVAGYNYSPQRYVEDHKRVPDRVMVATESFPADSFTYWEGVWDNSWVIGDFIWTAIDYLGESSIGSNGDNTPALDACPGYCTQPFPYHVSYCGDLDLIGQRKPQGYYRQVLWNVTALEFAVHSPVPKGQHEVIGGWGWQDERQSWTWPGSEGVPLQVNVYSQQSDHVQLVLNGKPIGDRLPVSRSTKFTATTSVPYTAGTLQAVGYLNGNPVTHKELVTSTGAHKIVLYPDRNPIRAHRDDLAYVTVEIQDEHGVLYPVGSHVVSFRLVGGNGRVELAAVGSGDPIDIGSVDHNVRRTFRGRCLAIVRPGTASSSPQPGTVEVLAQSTGLVSGSVTLNLH